jgi:prepilin-type N-terminal cleavage/methylation domain-containing protein
VKIKPRKLKKGVTLMELLCVLAIIGILLALYLPSLSRAFVHAKNFLFGLKGD